MVQLRGIYFPSVCNASGAQGFFGEGYWYHGLFMLKRALKRVGFVSKTTTIEPRLNPGKKQGNMPMTPDGITPKEWKPKCIIVNPWTGDVLNAVGLSGPGAKSLIERKIWQRRDSDPWFLSFMSVLSEKQARLDQLKEWVRLLLASKIHNWNSCTGIEWNVSCPNTKLDPSDLIGEIGEGLDILGALNVPIRIKFNALAPVREIAELIMSHPACDAVVMGNTIPWGKFPEIIPWRKCFGSDISPLKHLDGGGLSGPRLLPIHCQWIQEAIGYGLQKPIWGCGGIYSPRDVDSYKEAGASGIQIGSGAIVRPWRMARTIRHANRLFRV